MPEPTREQRKVGTVLFCDLVGSTALGESTDPEALRARMRRYFKDLSTIIERHGAWHRGQVTCLRTLIRSVSSWFAERQRVLSPGL